MSLRQKKQFLGIIILGAIGVIAVAVAAPSFFKAKLAANEVRAETRIKTIIGAIDSYANINNGEHPLGIHSLTSAKPPYLSEEFDNKTIQGYNYYLISDPKEYTIIAEPSSCGVTGSKIFKASVDGAIYEEECQ